jgi:hypothetical protein
MRSEVYSWRVSTELKTGLERAARRRGRSVAAVLDEAAREWLQRSGADPEDDSEQRRLHESAARFVGVYVSGETRSEKVRETVRERLKRRHSG